MSMPARVAASILSWSSLRISPSWKLVPVPVIIVGESPYFFRIGTCCAVGRSTPLKPSFDRIWHRSSNENFVPPHTDVITLCLMGARVAGGFCEARSEEHTSELQSQSNLVCRLLLEKKNKEGIE